MSGKVSNSQVVSCCWVGVDWGESRHAVSVVDDARSLLSQFEVASTAAGLAELGARLEDQSAVAGVAIEATANLVLEFLLSRDAPVYVVNPKMSKSWREACSVSGIKSDTRDGHVLALELARRHEALRPMRPAPAQAEELAGLSAALRDMVDGRTALLQGLKSALRHYYPAALDCFSDWGSPVAWRFLKKWPNPQKLAGARKQTLCAFLKSNRVGLSPRWLDRIAQAPHATDWPCPRNHAALEARMLSLVAQLQALQPHIDALDVKIAELCEALPQASLMQSLPGAGKRLAPALTAIAALLEEEPDRLAAMRCLSGVAPVEHSSGKRCATHMRKRCNKHWRNAMHLYARSSTQYCAWAKAFYDMRREKGDRYATALRKLADKWLKIIHQMLAHNEPYDDERYVKALKESRSPVYERLCGKACG